MGGLVMIIMIILVVVIVTFLIKRSQHESHKVESNNNSGLPTLAYGTVKYTTTSFDIPAN